MRKATPLRGIVASGWSVKPPQMGEHWGEDGRSALYVPLEFDAMVNPYSNDLLPVEALMMGTLRQVNWNTMGGGIEIPDDALKELDRLWTAHLIGQKALRLPRLPPKERSLQVVRRKERDSAFSKKVRALSKGLCAACPPRFDYGGLGILETAHIKAVEHDGPDDVDNALALCPNHHALFDEGLWTIGTKTSLIFAKALPRSFRDGFGSELNCSWALNPKHLKWHREEVFKR
ncbi:MAG: HNH endonuclease [Hyalangium sp.]|uniref:HNH endonuclease n=1 Tax=Hyalangium sp. TaxID=2028555 RepID=UPI00389A3920